MSGPLNRLRRRRQGQDGQKKEQQSSGNSVGPTMSLGAVVSPRVAVCVFFLVLQLLAPSHAQNQRCQNPSRQTGRCIALQQCPELVAVIQRKPLPPVHAKFLKDSQCGYSGSQPKVCCPNQAVQLPQAAADEGPDDYPFQENPLIPGLRECGEYIENKIVGGEATDLNEFPWMALLEYTKPNGKGFHCGGSLISKRYVLTAAHCIRGQGITPSIRLTSIRLGEYDTKSATDCSGSLCSDDPVDIPVESITVHSNYNPSSRDQKYDIALVRLSREVEYTDWIAPICLPLVADSIRTKSWVGELLTVAGWGKTEVASESDLKLKVQVPVVDGSQCTSIYQRLGVRLSSSQMCAGGRKDRDSCRGDSGGPLMVLQEQGAYNNWFLAGIVSFGPTPCGSQNWPGVYTDVSKYSAWITRNVKP